jgi:hypothetical protein
MDLFGMLLLWSVFASIAAFPGAYNQLFAAVQRTHPRWWVKTDFESPFSRTWTRIVGLTGVVVLGTGIIVEFTRVVGV